MNPFDAVLLGIVEGLTEFLPVSSTAHLMLSAQLLELEQTEFLKTFEIAIQPGAILAVVVLYWRKLLVEWRVLWRVCLAFVPTAILGLTAYKIIKSVFLSDTYLALTALSLGGIVLIFFEMHHKGSNNSDRDIAQMPIWQCVLIGLIQSASFIPGVSRAAATIIGGLATGLSRKTAVEFSFLLAIPTMGAATGWDLVQSFIAEREDGLTNQADLWTWHHVQLLAVGFVTSFVVAIVSIKGLLWFVRRNSFVLFGFYRILIWIVLMAWMTMASGG